MATRIGALANLCKQKRVTAILRAKGAPVVNTVRCLSERSTSVPGIIPPEPLGKRFSLVQVLVCIGFGVYVGQYIAKTFASFLEETEMFVPEDDDD